MKLIKYLKEEISIPLAIIIGSFFIASSFYFIQIQKQKSIENQQEIKNKREECESLSSGVRDQWGNVMGVTYDDTLDECVVTYTDHETGEVKTSPLNSMSTIE